MSAPIAAAASSGPPHAAPGPVRDPLVLLRGWLVHDEKSPEPSLAYLLSRMRHPDFPEPVGVFRAVDRPKYDEELNKQVEAARAEKGPGNLAELFEAGETWSVT